MKLKDLIFEAGGVTADIFSYRIEVARIDPKNLDEKKYAKIIVINLNNEYDVFKIHNSKDIMGEPNLMQNEFFLKPYDNHNIQFG